jgi:hypothetical protein
MAHACSQPPKKHLWRDARRTARQASLASAPTTIAAGEARPIDGLITAPLRDDRLSGGLLFGDSSINPQPILVNHRL